MRASRRDAVRSAAHPREISRADDCTQRGRRAGSWLVGAAVGQALDVIGAVGARASAQPTAPAVALDDLRDQAPPCPRAHALVLVGGATTALHELKDEPGSTQTVRARRGRASDSRGGERCHGSPRLRPRVSAYGVTILHTANGYGVPRAARPGA